MRRQLHAVIAFERRLVSALFVERYSRERQAMLLHQISVGFISTRMLYRALLRSVSGPTTSVELWSCYSQLSCIDYKVLKKSHPEQQKMLLDLDNVKGKCLAFGVVVFIGKYDALDISNTTFLYLLNVTQSRPQLVILRFCAIANHETNEHVVRKSIWFHGHVPSISFE